MGAWLWEISMRNVPTLILAAGLGLMGSAAAVTRMTIVTESGHAFSQSDLSLKVGDRVQFDNQDDTIHHVLVEQDDGGGVSRDLGLQAPNAAPVNFAFDSAGKFRVHCHIHSSMVLNVTVQ